MNLSIHTAPVIQPPNSKLASEQIMQISVNTTPLAIFLTAVYDVEGAYIYALPTS